MLYLPVLNLHRVLLPIIIAIFFTFNVTAQTTTHYQLSAKLIKQQNQQDKNLSNLPIKIDDIYSHTLPKKNKAELPIPIGIHRIQVPKHYQIVVEETTLYKGDKMIVEYTLPKCGCQCKEEDDGTPKVYQDYWYNLYYTDTNQPKLLLSTDNGVNWINIPIKTMQEETITSSNKEGNSDFSLPTSMKIFPNPAEKSTTIEYTLQHSCMVNLSLYSTTGELIKTIFNNKLQQKGTHSRLVNVKKLPTGTYHINLNYCDKKISQSIIVQ